MRIRAVEASCVMRVDGASPSYHSCLALHHEAHGACELSPYPYLLPYPYPYPLLLPRPLPLG